jgi:serine/threonine protein kinase
MEFEDLPLDIGDYRLKEKLGRGSFAVVWLAEHKILKTDVAIKVIARSAIESEDLQTRFVRELNIIKQMDHPFIAKLYEIITTSTHTYVVQELAERGSLLNLVNTHGRLPESNARRYFSQLVSALEYLHDERMIAHRDLKAENVLLDRNLNIRLIDFGLSQTFSKDTPQLLTAAPHRVRIARLRVARDDPRPSLHEIRGHLERGSAAVCDHRWRTSIRR